MRGLIQDIYLSKSSDILSSLRSIDGEGEAKKELQQEITSAFLKENK